jgi:hypothetical protein
MRVLLLALALCWAPTLAAQQVASDDPRYVPAAPVLELRAVVPVGDHPEFQVGPGLSLRAGWYVRGSVAVLGGALKQDSATIGLARVEAAVRFHIDPFFQGRGLYGGAGFSQRFLGAGLGADDPVLLLILGLEGPRSNAGVWAVEVGVGGGLRLGATWRQNRKDRYR